MSPLGVRRWRADRLLRKDFKALQASVLSAVRRRMRGAGTDTAAIDLEACYAQAWQGLYAAILSGEEIANPAGWLVVVTHRRAIDELRALMRASRAAPGPGALERDLAAELDERGRLRELLEGLRTRLSPKEREAAALCYLQGLTRAQAAAQMGLSERAFGKLMEGRGAGRPGVAAKMGELVQTIGQGRWCEQQGSLMRALAYGMLDPDGERYPVALGHSSQCPACRAYVASLRGLAAALPPVLLQRSAAASLLARFFGHAHHGGAGAGSGSSAAGAGGGAGGAALAGGGAAGAGAASAGGLGATGGGWLLAGGSVGAKLAAGCVLALSIGAGCIAVGTGSPRAPRPPHRHASQLARRTAARGAVAARAAALQTPTSAKGERGATDASGAALTPTGRASREFGPEQPAAASQTAGSGAGSARIARASSASREGSEHSATALAEQRQPAPPAGAGAPAASEAEAQREFSPG